MIGIRGGRAVLIASLLAATALSGTAAAHGASPAVRYASPTGVNSEDCGKAAPCDLLDAIQSAPTGAEVVIEPGNYYKDSPLGTDIENLDGDSLDVHGPTTGPHPVIYTTAFDGFFLTNSAFDYADVVASDSGTAVIDQGGAIEHVDVRNSDGVACSDYAAIIDTVCATTGTDATALSVEPNGGTGFTYHVRISGVTAESTSGEGLLVKASDDTTIKVNAVNDIFHGSLDDAYVETNATGATAVCTLTVSHSDYDQHQAVVLGAAAPGSATIVSDSGNITAAPTFIDAAHGDFRERSTSPTVDAGQPDSKLDSDVVGIPRTAGGAPDMGGYEFAPKPLVHGLKITKKTGHTAQLTVRVNPEGLHASMTLIAANGKHHKTITKSAGKAATTGTVKLTLHDLKPHTTYRVQATASNVGGTSKPTTKRLTTR